MDNYHPPIPLDKVPEIEKMYVTNASSRHLGDYIDRINTKTAHGKAYQARLKLCPKTNVGRKWPKEVTEALNEDVAKRLMAVLVMFDGTAAVITVKDAIHEEDDLRERD